MDANQVNAIMQQYRRQQLLIHMTGPLLSLIIHIVAISTAAVVLQGEARGETTSIEVTTIEIPIVEPEEMVVEEIEEVREEFVETAPTIDSPDAPVDDSSEVDQMDDSPIEDLPESDADAGDAMEEILAVETSNSPIKLSGYYAGRDAKARERMVRSMGGSRRSQDAVIKALNWFKATQNSNGSWANQPAHTGMALLCFLAHGETPLSEEYGTTVQRAMQYLATAMNSTKPDGACGGRAYSHGIATYALAEAYGMTQIPFLRMAMEKGIDRIIRGQQPGGGFDYRYKKGDRWDLSVAGWQYQALKAAKVAGSKNPGLDEAIRKSIRFCRRAAYKNGKFGYSSPGSGGNMTGVGTVALQLLGEADCPEVRAACQTIATGRLQKYEEAQKAGAREFGKKEVGGRFIYGWYYDTQAMFNASAKRKSYWRAWQRVFEPTLTKAQHRAGYWAAEGHGMNPENDAGRVLSTAWCCLQLEVYYRYLPTFDIKKMQAHSAASAGGGVGGLDDDSGLTIE